MKPELKRPGATDTELLKAVETIRTDAWNKCVSIRLESLRGWMSGDEWNKGFAAYMRGQTAILMDNLVRGCATRDDDQFLRGRISAMQDVLNFQEAVEGQIEAIKRNKDSASSRGNAGY